MKWTGAVRLQREALPLTVNSSSWTEFGVAPAAPVVKLPAPQQASYRLPATGKIPHPRSERLVAGSWKPVATACRC